AEEDRYSHTDLWHFQRDVERSQKILDLLRPQLQKANPELLPQVHANNKKVDTTLAKYPTKDGFETYAKFTDADRNALNMPHPP
ncbi:imelysin family protein, partial [Escherichia coli]|uniref:imelysin family protein n=1 Tax=Escherichia coli TaxID=562 RepID=UPI0013F85587